MFRTFRSRLQHYRQLLIPVTVLALILSPHTRVALHAADGDLDPTFGNGGIVTTDFGNSNDSAEEVVVQPDGKIVVAGTRGQDFGAARYNADGSLDATFGTGGLVFTDLFGNSFELARAMALQPDGKIVIVGQTQSSLGNPTDQDFALLRYNSDGTVDTTFGTNGRVRTDFGAGNLESALSVAIDSQGRIVAAGHTTAPNLSRDFAVARYNPDGTLDTTFDGDGRVISISATNFDGAVDVAIQADDRIVALGFLSLGVVNFAAVRYNTDGSLDTTFGGTGIVTATFGGNTHDPTAVVVQPDGKVLAVGSTFTNEPNNRDFALVRFNADGSPDVSFGIGGQVTTNFDSVDHIADVALQHDGRIVVTGRSNGFSGVVWALSRYEADGTLDVSFGVGGLVTTFINGEVELAKGIAIQADGKILVAGQTQQGTSLGFADVAIVRYEGTPPPVPHDLTFYLHGTDIAGTAGGFTMNATAPSTQVLLTASNSPSWYSDPVLDGTFQTGAAFEVTLPCVLGVGLPKTVRLASTDSGGGSEQVLGEAAVGIQFCQSQTIAVPVTTPATVPQGRLKLTILSPFAISPPLILGSQTFVRATNFTGTP
jgi:uncharacterized delta-60 repeat protein